MRAFTRDEMKFSIRTQPNDISSMRLDDRRFFKNVTSRIDGWLVDYAAVLTTEFLRIQEDAGYRAPLAEIGVYQGKYLSVLLASAARSATQVVAIDTFQFVPLDKVQGKIRDLAPDLYPLAAWHVGSSSDISPEQFVKMLGTAPRFISVDGSHETPDVIYDLKLCDETLAEEGLISVDDFLNPTTVGVNRAVNEFMSAGPRLEAVLYSANKLFLARPSHAQMYRDSIEKFLSRDQSARGVAFRKNRETWRGTIEVSFFSRPMLVATAPGSLH